MATRMREPQPVDLAVAAVRDLIADRLSVNETVRRAHARGEAFHPDLLPDAVAYAESADEVCAIVRICAGLGVPIIPFGAGTSLEGNVTAPFGGISIDLSRMDRVIATNVDDLDCAIEPGVTREQLNAHLRDLGLFFPIDPGANATIGGMCATRASGTNAVRYGTMRDNVLWLDVVMADGTLIRTAHRARKSAAGYDLTRLFVGSEGTLGIITQIGLKLHGLPEAVAVAIAPFETLRGAVESVVAIMQVSVPIARVELLDAVQVGAINAYSGTELALKPTLMFEFHGSEIGVKEQRETVGLIAADHGCEGFEWARLAEERSTLWKARHNAYFAAQALRPGSQLVVTDVCVPISALTDCITETHADIAEAGLVAPIVGHVGDGNFHVFFTVDPADPAEIEQVRRLNDRLVDRALAKGGTCTGEHGIGIGKQQKLIDELGLDTVDIMRRVKRALDPQYLLNPGKIFSA